MKCCNKYFRTGFFFSFAYLLTFIVMVLAWLNEYKVLASLAETNKIPAQNLIITSGIFAFSFVVRTVLDFTALVDSKAILNLQSTSCVNDKAGWAILVFITHFLGEIMPLSVLFWLQAKIYQKIDDNHEPRTALNDVDDSEKIRSTILTADGALRDSETENQNSQKDLPKLSLKQVESYSSDFHYG